MENRDDLVVEWSTKYVSTASLRQFIIKIEEIAHISRKNAKSHEYNKVLLKQMFNELESQFWSEVQSNIIKVDEFYSQELSRTSDKLAELKQFVVKTKNEVQTAVIQQNITEMYRNLDLLNNFANQNASQLRKLSRQWGVNSNQQEFESQIIENKLLKCKFADTSEIENLKEELVTCLCLLLDIPKKQAHDQLNKSYDDKILLQKATYQSYSGFFISISIILTITIINLLGTCRKHEHEFELGEIVGEITLLLFRVQVSIASVIICYGALVRACVYTHINYIYLFEIPQHNTITTSAQIVTIGFAYLSLVLFFALMSISSAIGHEYNIPLPFGHHLTKFAQLTQPAYWILFSTLFHLTVIYYVVLRIFDGRAPALKHLFTVVYRTITPWAHQIDLSNFCMGAHFTAWGPILMDLLKIITREQAKDQVLCLFEGIPYLIKVVQYIVKFRMHYDWYPQMLGAVMYSVSFVSKFIYQEHIIEEHTPSFWFFFTTHCIASIWKLYWDFFEDGSLFYGGYGGKVFRKQSSKWQYGKLCRRPSFIPQSWIYGFIIFNLIASWSWAPALLFPHNHFFHKYLYEWEMFIIVLEVFRRTCWCLFRMDNQQATNCESYVATRYIPILVSQHDSHNIQKHINHIQENDTHTQDTHIVSFVDHQANEITSHESYHEQMSEHIV
ncbi:EXS_family protein [Hexamita inflata]|uniref:EXS family protein n=1 Tax=Hexamita inflata TaxID=28002 RepID=A0AA86QB59_9EUKA|nr:EXS family protein [Hexamita inflata]